MTPWTRLGRTWRAGLVTAALLAGALGTVPAAAGPVAQTTPPAAATRARPDDPVVHDPTMVKEGGWYYVVSTGDAGRPDNFLPVKRSKDLLHWSDLRPVFTTLPPWILPALGLSSAEAPKDLWAPDLSFVHGEWRLYYAISQFGKNNSVIGLATTRTLDPASPDFGWVDRGAVLQSKPATSADPHEFNAIDPDFTTDAQGRGWLSFGSFWTGIKMRRVDLTTGKLSTSDTALHDLATRPTPPDALEGPSIVRHGGYYYLFVAFDFCCRGVDSDYRVLVGRSRSVTGPYVDRAGVPLLQGGGTEVLRGYNEFVGTGGADVYSSRGTDYFVNHYYDATDNGVPKLNVRTLDWTRGWPKVSDPVNPSRSVGHGDAYVSIAPVGSSTVVENDGCGYEGADIRLGDDLGNTCQQWQVSDRGQGSRILNRFSNKVAEVAACNNVDGGNVAQWGWLGFLPNNDCQRWTFAPTTNGYTAVTSLLPGHRVWNAAGGRTSAGTDVDIATRSTAPGTVQEFRFQPVGRVLLGSPTDRTATLGVAGCRTSGRRGREVGFRAGSSRCQQWRFERVPGAAASYTVTNVGSGRQLASSDCGRHRTPSSALRLVKPRRSNLDCRSWRLTPTDDGTWTLATAGATRTVRLLLP